MSILLRPVTPPERTTRHEELWRRLQRLQSTAASTSRTDNAQGTNRSVSIRTAA